MVCGACASYSVRVRGGSGQDFSNACGCGAEAGKKFQPGQDSISHRQHMVVNGTTMLCLSMDCEWRSERNSADKEQLLPPWLLESCAG